MNPDKLNGKKVVGAQGYVIGEVEGIDVDMSNWQAAGLFISLTDDATVELGFKKPFLSKVVICMPTNLVKAIGEVITINESLKGLKEIVEQVEK